MKIIFNSFFEFFQENNLLNENQSAFRQSDSFEYELLSIVHGIYIYVFIYCTPRCDVRGISLGILKAFDSVWHEELIYKVKNIGVTGLPLELTQRFLSQRLQRVVLNG